MFEKDPRTFEADLKNLSPEQKAMVKLEITLTQFFRSFDTSITRWERLVYPSLLVMAVLGLSGFYLIFNLTKDMGTLTSNIDPDMEQNLGEMSQHMAALSKNIEVMTGQITVLVSKIDSMESNISGMSQDTLAMSNNLQRLNGGVENMTLNVYELNQSVKQITANTSSMRRDINQISEPMDFPFLPW